MPKKKKALHSLLQRVSRIILHGTDEEEMPCALIAMRLRYAECRCGTVFRLREDDEWGSRAMYDHLLDKYLLHREGNRDKD